MSYQNRLDKLFPEEKSVGIPEITDERITELSKTIKPLVLRNLYCKK